MWDIFTQGHRPMELYEKCIIRIPHVTLKQNVLLFVSKWDFDSIQLLRSWYSRYKLLGHISHWKQLATAHFCYKTMTCRVESFNPLANGRAGCHFRNAIFNFIFRIGIFKSFSDNVLSWLQWGLRDDKSTLVKVMAWCRQTTSNYLNQCWPRSPAPYGVTRSQWVKQCEATY